MVPAAGVIATKPVIMPWTAPITEGFPKKMRSRMSQVNKLVAAATCVFNTAKDASMLAAYGSPPLNPVHPIHSSPAPANIRRILFGGNLSLSFVDLGPTCNHYHGQSFICKELESLLLRSKGKIDFWRTKKVTLKLMILHISQYFYVYGYKNLSYFLIPLPFDSLFIPFVGVIVHLVTRTHVPEVVGVGC